MTAYYAVIAGQLGGKAITRYKNTICPVMNDNEIYEHFDNDVSGNPICVVKKTARKTTRQGKTDPPHVVK